MAQLARHLTRKAADERKSVSVSSRASRWIGDAPMMSRVAFGSVVVTEDVVDFGRERGA